MKQLYKKLENPTEEEVNKLLKESYILHSVTPIIKPYTQSHSILIYHFTKNVYSLEYYNDNGTFKSVDE